MSRAMTDKVHITEADLRRVADAAFQAGRDPTSQKGETLNRLVAAVSKAVTEAAFECRIYGRHVWGARDPFNGSIACTRGCGATTR